MNDIIDIAKQELDTYEAELYAVGVLKKLERGDYERAYRNIRKLADELEKFLNE